MSRVRNLGVGLAMALWVCWAVALAAVFSLLVIFEFMSAALVLGPGHYTGYEDDQSMALYVLPVIAFVVVIASVTVVWPAIVVRKRRRSRASGRRGN